MLDAATILTELQNGANVACGSQDGRLHYRFVYLGDLASGRIFRRISYLQLSAVFHDHAIDHIRSGRNQIKIKFPLKALPHDLHVQQPEEPNPESEAKGTRGLRLVAQRGIVELQLVQGFP